MSNWIGYAISVNCGEPLGCYQGTILEANGSTITLTKAFRNGFPYPKSQVTLNAADIRDLKIIESRPEPAEQTHSTVAVTKGLKKAQRATVCENLQANPTSSGNQAPAGGAVSSKAGAVSNKAGASRACGPVPGTGGPGPGPGGPDHGTGGSGTGGLGSGTGGLGSGTGPGAAQPPPPARTKPIDIQPTRANKNANHSGSYGNCSSTPKSRGAGGFGNVYDKARRRNEACFGEAADAELDNDFDFEGNLALFNKRALWEQIRNSHKPDVVRQADDLGKFRHDENVLGAAPAPRCAILVPDELRGEHDYVTDEGLVVPSAAAELRVQLWAALRRVGLLECARTLLARAVADVALRLVGGGRRLDPRNAHQAPTVVALVGAHGGGAAGLLAARLLASHGARAAALVCGPAPAPGPGPGPGHPAPPCADLARELAVLAPSGVLLAPDLASLPRPDLVLLALRDPILDEPQDQYQAAVQWAGGSRAGCVCVEPGADGSWAPAGPRAAVQAGLPGALGPALGQLHLADVCVPPQMFAELRVQYRPPFGASPVLPLHPHHH